MHKSFSIAIVVPAYNAQHNIADGITNLLHWIDIIMRLLIVSQQTISFH
jgi:hypothetical protein